MAKAAASKRAPAKRIAVVFVHGQGEQTPMTDVVELAESIWRTDPRAVLKPEDALDERNLAEIYSVPVYDEEFSDQRRVVTREVAGRRVDFYQFYWADLMKGNKFQHLWVWFADLMTRKPSEIPDAIWPIRQTAMFLALGIAVWGAALAFLTSAVLVDWLSAPGLAVGVPAAVLGFYLAFSAHRGAKGPPDKAKAQAEAKGVSIVTGLVALGLLGLTIWPVRDEPVMYLAFIAASVGLWAALKVWPRPADWDATARRDAFLVWLLVLAAALAAAVGLLISGGQVFQRGSVSGGEIVGLALFAGALFTFGQVWSPRRRAASFQMGFILLLLALAAACLPPAPGQGDTQRLLAAALSAIGSDENLVDPIRRAAILSTLAGVALLGSAGWWLNSSFLAPVMTDSARMFSSSPVNIPNQNAIRERGMQLLRNLHAKGTTGAPGDDPPYERIIVLAHSLGTVVAYRLLTHYWGSVHRTLCADPADAAARKDIDELAAKIDPARTGAPPLGDAERNALLADWRAAVRTYWKALNPVNQSPSPWRISDFVTIGSPLTYAALLMEKKDRDFSDQVEVFKRYPTSPQQTTNAAMKGAFSQHGLPHHGAMFAATCWTNLFFPSHGLAHGDMIGGPLHGDHPKGLGPGVLDVNLDHDNSVSGFTHSEYWRWPARAQRLLRPFQAQAGGPVSPPPPHVGAMRDALDLFEDGPAADRRLMEPLKSYPNGTLPAEDDG